jgi:hypothetical protein
VSNHRLSTSLALVAIGAIVAGTGTAAAATGGTFLLGRDNTAGTTTILRNSGTAANLTLPAARVGQPPLAVNSWSGKVNNLNTDKLDGFDSTAFALAGGRVGSIESFGQPLDVDADGTHDVYVAQANCPAGSKVTGGGHETWTVAGAVVSRADGNGWVVVTIPDADTVSDDIVAVAQCYNPRGAVARAVESFGAGAVELSAEERTRLVKLASKR